MTMDDCIRMAKPFGYKVIVIDYVGLLEGRGRRSVEIANERGPYCAKTYTQETGALVILLAQLDDEKEKALFQRYERAR